ncbi:MAG: UDP-N-acetylmuramoyl-tripeptide--D-alanyl-D-alanine ligase, partial [Ktedonobacteraceae bacterium]
LSAGMKPEQTYFFSADVENVAELEAVKHAVADLLVHEVHSEDLVLLKASHGIHSETMLSMW